MKYHLIIHPELKQDMDRLYQAYKQDQNSPQGREFKAAVDALKALREGRESEYQGKQLGYGLRDSPPAGTAPKPSTAPAANVNRPTAPTRTQDRNLDS